MGITRRSFVVGTATLTGSQLLGASFWQNAFAAAAATPGTGPYGPLQAADANALELPVGFTSRLIGRTGDVVPGTTFNWHGAPDGGGTFAAADGGWIYVSNAELGNAEGGVSAVRFAPDGSITDAYTILSGTNRNCSGGVTPWGTWLSCEETGLTGEVFECDPQQPGQGVIRPLLGKFNHEAAAVDPVTSEVYLTEDSPSGRLYKFVPDTFGDLSAGELFAAVVAPGAGGGPDGGTVSWVRTSSDGPDRQAETTPFDGGEGVYLGAGVLYFATKGDRRVWELDMATAVLEIAYDCLANPDGDLDAVDAVVVHDATQRVFVAEDGGNMEVAVMAGRNGQREVAAFCRFAGHGGSEVTGTAFSPDGTRLYLSSQRGTDGSTGVTLEIIGPFDRPFGDDPPPTEPVIVAFTESAFVRGGSFADTTFASAWLDQVCTNGSEQYARHTYLRTDIPAAIGTIAQATMLVNARMSSGDPSPMDLLAVDPDWSSTSLTWNNRPAPAAVPVQQFIVQDTAASWYSVDVTAHVAAQRAAGQTSIAFVVSQAARNGRLGYLYAPTSNNAPYLEITTTDIPPPPPPVTLRLPMGAYVRGGSAADTNFAGSFLHQVCNNGSAQYVRETYFALSAAELSGLGAPSNVTLQLWARMSSGGPSAMTVSLATADWDPMSITWSTRLGAAPSPVTGFTIDTTDDAAYDIDVTGHLVAAVAAGASTITFVVRQAERNGRVGYVHTAARSTRFPRLIHTQA